MSDQQIKFTLPNGQEVYTGNLVPDVLPVSFKPYPPTKVRPLSEFTEIAKQVKKIRKDISAEMRAAKWLRSQGRRGSCNCFMVRNMWGVLTYRSFGKWIDISPEHLYCRINGGRDAGSMLDDGMVEMTDNGCVLWDDDWYEQFQANKIPMEMMRHANEQGKQQRFQECYQASRQSVEACWQSLCCCLLDGGAVGVAVHVGNSYLNSGKGIAGFDRGPGNHAIAGSDFELLTDMPRSWADVAIKSPQSWGADFADGNVTTLTIKHIEEPMKYHGLYCARSVWQPDYLQKEFKA